ncbi:MAG: transketolase [Ancalomicrobiaceae bacterium]|nr:transketolase [Ancalomicrobiaceae bacterium]
MTIHPDLAAATQPPLATLMANALRVLAVDGVEQAKSGHPGMPLGMADVATVLFRDFLKFDATHPTWPDRDRFVLSGGHGSMLLYGLLHLCGYEGMTLEALKSFRQLGSAAAGHPEVDPAVGIEMTTGPLGQGLATAVGMALGERILNARFGDALVDHRTWVMCGDGDMMEGISHEAASFAGHLGLSKLIVLWDDNGISIDGPTSLSFSDDVLARFASYGWATSRVDGHDQAAIAAAISAAIATGKPALIAARTIIGYGAPTKAGTSAAHGAPLGADEVAGVRRALGWSYPPFEVPPEIRAAWAAVGERCAAVRTAWEDNRRANAQSAAFERALKAGLPELDAAIAALKRAAVADRPKLATRAASGRVLEALVPLCADLVGGSADLTPSNNTRVKTARDIRPGDFSGDYVRYGVREFGMATAMNGLALHGGIIPFGGTFLVFVDYARPALRLAALMGLRVIHVMTHDSIGVGEDGPTHQPVEQLASLRAMPNLQVFRPADLVETAECWQLALQSEHAPSVLALSRQEVPTLRQEAGVDNLSARGGYVLAEATRAPRRVTLVATGTEVSLAMDARDVLEAEGIGTAVVSMPCFSLFEAQPQAYRAGVLRPGTVRVGIEAAIRFGWDRIIGEDGIFIGMTGFGASGPGAALYRHFGITSEAIVAAVRQRLAAAPV